MPDSFHRKGRWYFTLGFMVALTIALIVVTTIAHDAQVKANEQVRDTRVAEVAACYASARGRPRLILILRAIAGTIESDAAGRMAIRELTDEYEQRTPLVSDCTQLAVSYHLDPADFPPPTPRGEENTP